MPNMMPAFFGSQGCEQNPAIIFTDPTSQKPFTVIAVQCCPDMHLLGAAAGSVTIGFSRLAGTGFHDNITSWGLDQFRKQYQSLQIDPERVISKRMIFHYVYAVLHDPVYREKYALNLKREFPRIPFYADFWLWADWGRQLMELHVGYESIEPWLLKRIDLPFDGAEPVKKGSTKSVLVALEARKPSANPKADSPKPALRADKPADRIVIDSQTTLTGIPYEAWEYRLGTRSALEWVLDQHKERTPKDPTVSKMFNTYRFADYKEKVIDLLRRVTRVSVETQAIISAMKKAPR